ncbi:hypothetical protein DER45DRAFT_628428 [Fusarium avenaceum]|nr:hypothetical protein DER45DRAFT_628428 [Fusarium avenaceum]
MLSHIPWYRRPLVPEAALLTCYTLLLWTRVFPHAPGIVYRWMTAQPLRHWMWRRIMKITGMRMDLERVEE